MTTQTHWTAARINDVFQKIQQTLAPFGHAATLHMADGDDPFHAAEVVLFPDLRGNPDDVRASASLMAGSFRIGCKETEDGLVDLYQSGYNHVFAIETSDIDDVIDVIRRSMESLFYATATPIQKAMNAQYQAIMKAKAERDAKDAAISQEIKTLLQALSPLSEVLQTYQLTMNACWTTDDSKPPLIKISPIDDGDEIQHKPLPIDLSVSLNDSNSYFLTEHGKAEKPLSQHALLDEICSRIGKVAAEHRTGHIPSDPWKISPESLAS